MVAHIECHILTRSWEVTWILLKHKTFVGEDIDSCKNFMELSHTIR